MNGSITSLLLVPGPAPAQARPGRYPAPEPRVPEPVFRRHLSAALAAPDARPADHRTDPPRAGDTEGLRREDPADDAPRADRLPDPKAAEAARTHSHGRPAGQTGRAGAPNQPAAGDPAGTAPETEPAADSDDEAAATATGDTPPAQAGPNLTPPAPDGVTAGILPVPQQPAGAPDSAAPGAPDSAVPGAGSAAAQAADAARAAGVPAAPAVLAAVRPGGGPRAGGLPADAAAFGARTLRELAAAAAPDQPVDGAAPQPPVTLPVEPKAPFHIPGAPAWAAGGNPGNPGAPGSQSGTADSQGGAATPAGPNQPAAGPSLADLIQLVHQSAARLDEPATAPATDSLPPHLSPAAAAAAPAPAPVPAAFPADLTAPARPAVQVDPRLVAEQVATAARRVSLAVSGDRSELRVRLWPRELGELHLKLVMENGALRADIVVARPEVKAALDAGLSDLRQRLEQQGLHVESFQVALGGGDAGRQSRQGTAPEFYGRSQRRVPIRPLDLDDGATPAPVADLALAGSGPRGRHLNGWA